MCREDSSTPMLVDPSQETPPRAWGRQKVALSEASKVRNTPTCVGKTHASTPFGAHLQKHPHVRGEDKIFARVIDDPLETPPRAWGRLPPELPACTSLGNTPTCVGKTFIRGRSGEFREKHPHVRGEDRTKTLSPGFDLETPPRAWGRHCLTPGYFDI